MNKNRLMFKLAENDISVDEISDKIGCSKSTFYRKVKNQSFTIPEIQTISKTLELSEDWFMSIFFENCVSDMRFCGGAEVRTTQKENRL